MNVRLAPGDVGHPASALLSGPGEKKPRTQTQRSATLRDAVGTLRHQTLGNVTPRR